MASPRTRALILLAIPLLAYLPVLRGGFIWDDESYVTQNPTLRTVNGLGNIWLHPSTTPQYYPLVHTTFWIEYHLWGASPAAALAYKILNLLLHALSVLLLWRLLTRLQIPGAFLAAAVFAVHPVNVESVAWITERKNILSGVFYLLAFGKYLQSIDQDQAPKISRKKYALALLFFFLALLSKTVTATLPAAILLILWWENGRLRRRDFIPLIPFFLTGILMAGITGYLEQTHVGASGPEFSSLTFLDRLLIAGRIPWFYAGKLLLPVNLSYIYPRWVIDPHDPAQYFWPLALLATVVLLFLLRSRITRGPLAAVLFFIGTLSPALGFANVLPMRYSFVADHFQYLASIGLIVLFAALITKIKFTRARTVISIAIIAALTTLTIQRVPILNDSETLWRDTLRKNPDSWMAHANLGHILKAQGRSAEAFVEYQQELQLAPNLAEPHLDLGLALTSDLPAAIAQFQKAIELNPQMAPAYMYLSNALRNQNRLPEAESTARAGTLAVPNYAPTWYELGRALESEKKFQEASTAYSTAITLDPDNPDAHFHQAQALQQLGQTIEAARQYQIGMKLQSHSRAAN